MARSLIDGIYDLYLSASGKGVEYDVPICIKDNNTNSIKKLNVRVWALSAKEAEERAIALTNKNIFDSEQSIDQKSMGIVLPREHYKPKGIKQTLTSPIAVWRDPVYKKAWSNIFGAVGYRFGTMTKLSIKELNKQAMYRDESENISKDYLNRVLKINIISIFIWVGLFILGTIFLMLGIHPGNLSRFVISWLNPYLVASIICIVIGAIAIYKSVMDYKWIVKKITLIENGSSTDVEIKDE